MSSDKDYVQDLQSESSTEIIQGTFLLHFP